MLKKNPRRKKKTKKLSKRCLAGGCGVTSGSGLMEVESFDRARHRGSNGGC
jgi:hypothetical protein